MNELRIPGQAGLGMNIDAKVPRYKYLITLSISFLICKVEIILTRLILQGKRHI